MKRTPFILLLLLFTSPLWAQSQAVNGDEQLGLVGIRLAELIEQFGTPSAVLTARGSEPWQDDVVFQYAKGDFFINRDRVWQVKLASACGISNGDKKAVALLVMGEGTQDKGDHLLLPINGRDWPLMLRVNLNSTGQVSAIYIYRPDF